MNSRNNEAQKTFGGLLRSLRKQAGLTQRELGERVGYSESQINKLERRNRAPAPEVVATVFLTALDIQPNEDVARLIVTLAANERKAARFRAHVTHQHNLPSPLTSFIGRAREVNEVAQVLRTERLVTLWGPGGCGKSRLALEVAERGIAQYEDGTWLVELASLVDPVTVPQAICNVLRLAGNPEAEPVTVLVATLRNRTALVVLDNCEHLISACSNLVVTLLRACPNLKILATSREPLRAPGEVRWWVPSLHLPDENELTLSAEQLSQFEAVHLFIERAQAVRGAVPTQITSSAARAIAEICRRLDGMPLAIELAAARIATLSVEAIHARLDERFKLLVGGNRTDSLRQQSLRAAIEWSTALLTDLEYSLLRRLSVFSGGFTLQAVETVCADPTFLRAANVLDVLSGLVEKSLVQVVVDDTAADSGLGLRYGMLETIREYATDSLQTGAAAEIELLAQRHAMWCLSMVESAEPRLFAHDQVIWLRQLKREQSNIRKALNYLIEKNDAERAKRLVGALRRFWQTRGHAIEGRTWAAKVLALSGDVSPVADTKAYFTAAVLANYQGDEASRQPLLEHAIAYALQTNDPWLIGQVLAGIVSNPQTVELYKKLKERLATMLTDAKRLGNDWLIGNALHKIATLELDRGNLKTAQQHFRESNVHLTNYGDGIYSMLTLKWLGNIALKRGNFQQAEDDYTAALRIVENAGLEYSDHIGIWYCLRGLAEVVAHARRPDLMAQLLGVVELDQEEQGGMPTFWFALLDQSAAMALYEHITATPADSSDFCAHWETGRQMSLQQAVEFALKLDLK